MKKIFFVLIFSSFFYALDFDSLNVALKDSYGMKSFDFQMALEGSKRDLERKIQASVSQFYNPDKFLITVKLQNQKIFIHDSTEVKIKIVPPDSTFTMTWKDPTKSPYYDYGENKNSCQFKTFWIMGFNPYLGATMQYDPVVNIYFENSLVVTKPKAVKELVAEALKNYLDESAGNIGSIDADLCWEFVSIESSLDLKAFKDSLIEQELKELAVIEYNIEKGFIVLNEEYGHYLEALEVDINNFEDNYALTFNRLLDDSFLTEIEVEQAYYTTHEQSSLTKNDDGTFNTDIINNIYQDIKKYNDYGYTHTWDFGLHPLVGLTKIKITVFIQGQGLSEYRLEVKNKFAKQAILSVAYELENCDACIVFELIDNMYVLKTEMMNKELKDKTVIEYSANQGFTFYDSTYINAGERLLLDTHVTPEESFLFELNNLSKRCADNINGLLDDAYFVEASVLSAKYILIEDSKKIDQLQGEGKYEEAGKIMNAWNKKLERWEDVAYVRGSFNGNFSIISKLFLKINVDENDSFIKEIVSSPEQKKKSFDKIRTLIYSQYKDLESCDDCIVFELTDFNDLKANQLAKKNQINRSDVYDSSWAVIIGINDYPNAPQLNYAVKDAQNVHRMLIDNFDFPEDNIRFLINEQATFYGIRSALNDIKNKAGENDRVIVFYSGHGQTVVAHDGSNLGYLIPYEGTLEDPYGTGMSMNLVQQMGLVSKAKHMLFLMDACYSGLMAETRKGGLNIDKGEEGYLAAISSEDSRQIITAGRKDQEVIERDEWQNSAFTKNLLSALNDWKADVDKDGYITAEELGFYLKKTVTEDSNQQQTPINSRFRQSGDGEFIFFKN